jgi:hypothetical protein
VIFHNMKSVSDVLREVIQASGKPLLAIERETGVHRASISRFLRGKCWLRSDAVDKLRAHFNIRVTRHKE